MLNLKELERKLDLALSQETVESFTNWLYEERSKTYLGQLGVGTFSQVEKSAFEVTRTSCMVFNLSAVTIEVDNNMTLAA